MYCNVLDVPSPDRVKNKVKRGNAVILNDNGIKRCSRTLQKGQKGHEIHSHRLKSTSEDFSKACLRLMQAFVNICLKEVHHMVLRECYFFPFIFMFMYGHLTNSHFSSTLEA